MKEMVAKLDSITTATIKGTLFSDVYRDADQVPDEVSNVSNGLVVYWIFGNCF